jgi:hypothetical protein
MQESQEVFPFKFHDQYKLLLNLFEVLIKISIS